jgi:pyruvate,water dikinase
LGEVLHLDQVQPGEILVAENIDPGWTSVFPLLGGLVTETGGVLSHGALLAREYGIPAVMGVRNATRRFSTGMEATVDGSTGRVKILNGE